MSGKKRLSVIIPSRTQPRQTAFLSRAIESVAAQTALDNFEVAIIVGVDAGAALDARIGRKFDIRFVESAGRSQAAALNAAIGAADGDFVAFLEDDDSWTPFHLACAWDAVAKGAGFVSSTQLEQDDDGAVLRINDFPTPSGWFMPHATLRAVGTFDESFSFHLDNEWLGRLAETQIPRVHLVEATAPIDIAQAAPARPWLVTALQRGGGQLRLVRHSHPYPLVNRLVHTGSGMAQIEANAFYKKISEREYDRLMQRFGRQPW